MKSSDASSSNWIDASLREAKALGYLEDNLEVHFSGRVPRKLLKAAKLRKGIRSNTKLLMLSLSLLAIRDESGERLLKREGSIDPSLKLDF
jgi:hypothetical protein